MSIHRYTVAVGVAGIFFGLGITQSHAQAPPMDEARTQPELALEEPADQPDDAAARALRSLYVPGGLT